MIKDKMLMIKAVIFDLGGVLIDLDMHRCFENIKSLGVDIDKLNQYGHVDSNLKGATICEGVSASGLMHLYQVGKVSTEDFLGAILKLSDSATTYQQVADAWNSCLLTIPHYKLDFIYKLRSEGYVTYLLSNTNDAHWKYIREKSFPQPINTYFDKCFLSQEMGMAKPNADIYESVISQIPFSANECLFIDDSKANCEAAEAVGIQTINVPVRTDFRENIYAFLQKTQ